MTEPSSGPAPRDYGTGRLEAFSDGVFAIAITLLVLDLSLPLSAGRNLLEGFLDEWPSYLAYIVSFSTVAAVWFGHHAITERLARTNSTLLRLNMLLLLIVSLLPFPTRVLAEFIKQGNAERVAVTVYGVVLLLTSVLLSGLWRYARSAHLTADDAGDEDLDLLTERLTPSMAGYLVMIVLGLFLPIVAVFGYLLVSLFVLIPIRMPWRPSGTSPSVG
ncbi:TMEM175 family protein [Nostocoides japonicum]|uniref:TMEM175 family protein n=1 Tax=Nostocoides japonicum TaxID=99481 RepID=UPI00138F50BD|nr:TMEM175 family protein [Tetrasphaera japonica]